LETAHRWADLIDSFCLILRRFSDLADLADLFKRVLCTFAFFMIVHLMVFRSARSARSEKH